MEMCVCVIESTHPTCQLWNKGDKFHPSNFQSKGFWHTNQKFHQRTPDCGHRSLFLTPGACFTKIRVCKSSVSHAREPDPPFWPPVWSTSWDLLKTVSVSMLFETVSPVASSMPQGLLVRRPAAYQPACPFAPPRIAHQIGPCRISTSHLILPWKNKQVMPMDWRSFLSHLARSSYFMRLTSNFGTKNR